MTAAALGLQPGDTVRLQHHTCPDRTLFIDDEDEFAAHQVEFGYPLDVVRRAEQECAAVFAEVLDGAPWSRSATAQSWFSRLADLTA